MLDLFQTNFAQMFLWKSILLEKLILPRSPVFIKLMSVLTTDEATEVGPETIFYLHAMVTCGIMMYLLIRATSQVPGNSAHQRKETVQPKFLLFKLPSFPITR